MKKHLIIQGTALGPLGILALLLCASCNSSSFDGQAKKNSPSNQAPAAGTLGLNATCDQNVAAADMIVKSPASGISIVLKGNLCPTTQATVQALKQVIFLVDVSGSTRTTDPSQGNTCGRLVAAQSLANALKQQIGANDRKLAVITFDGAAQLISTFVPIANSDSILTYAALCSNGSVGGTNYDAAFSLVKQQITGTPAGNLVYLFSDGVPNMSGSGGGPISQDQGAKAAGLNAVNQCRVVDPSLLTYAVFLNANGDSTSSEAFSYLTTITGAADHVSVVSNAGDLASAALKLLPPSSPSKLTATKAEGVLSGTGLASTSIPLDVDSTVTLDGAKTAIGFVSKPFRLLGTPQVPVRQTLHVTMTDTAGQTYQQDYHLIYQLTP